MSATVSVTANGNVVRDDGSQGWNKNKKNRAALASATFAYSWNMAADKKVDVGTTPPASKFTEVTGPTGLLHHENKTWPVKRRSLVGNLNSTADAKMWGWATVYPGDWWNHWKAFTFVWAKSVPSADGGKAFATATVTDPWKIKYHATGKSTERNLFLCNVHFGGSVAAGSGGAGFSGPMGRFGVAVSKAGGFQPVAQLKPGWNAYLNVHFDNRRNHMKIPKAATVAEIKKALVAGFNAKTRKWKTAKGKLRLTFTKNLGHKGGTAILKIAFNAAHGR